MTAIKIVYECELCKSSSQAQPGNVPQTRRKAHSTAVTYYPPAENGAKVIDILGCRMHASCAKRARELGLLQDMPRLQVRAGLDDPRTATFGETVLSKGAMVLEKLMEAPEIGVDNACFSEINLRSTCGRHVVTVIPQAPLLGAPSARVGEVSNPEGLTLTDFLDYQTGFRGRDLADAKGSSVAVTSSPPATPIAHEGYCISPRAKRSESEDLRAAGEDPAGDVDPSPPVDSLTPSGRSTPAPEPLPSDTALQQAECDDFVSLVGSGSMALPSCRELGARVDMTGWEYQLAELAKLPDWMRHDSACNILGWMRAPIEGMSAPQLLLKVPGLRTCASEENNRFRSFNINHGPGKCTWAAVAAEHVPKLRALVKSDYNIEIYDSAAKAWVPDLGYCLRNNIPVMVGSQCTQDIVAVGIGALHWDLATASTVQSAWSFGERSVAQSVPPFLLSFPPVFATSPQYSQTN